MRLKNMLSKMFYDIVSLRRNNFSFDRIFKVLCVPSVSPQPTTFSENRVKIGHENIYLLPSKRDFEFYMCYPKFEKYYRIYTTVRELLNIANNCIPENIYKVKMNI